MKEISELKIQKQIHSIIKKNPGLHLSKVAEMLQISIPLALYHLRYLEKNDLITSVKEEGYLRYYESGVIGTKERKFLSLFRQEISLKIILYLLKNPKSRHKDIVKNLELSRSLISYHLKKLVKKEVIKVVAFEEEHGYVVCNPKEVVRFLVKYEPYNLFEGVNKTWLDFTMK